MVFRWMVPFGLLLVAAAGCTSGPGDGPRLPLPACDASRFAREAHAPTASQRVSLVLLAVQEWAWFGSQEVDYTGDAPFLRRAGAREDGMAGTAFWPQVPRRIAAYWRAAGFDHRDGLDRVPWSAAFVSWLFVNAGVPAAEFCPDQAHAVYVERLVDRASRPDALLIPRRPSERSPEPGDLICAARASSGLSLDNLNRGAGHCDLVVERRAREVLAIGGNVHDSVSRSTFPLDPYGNLIPVSARPFFTVIENRLP